MKKICLISIISLLLSIPFTSVANEKDSKPTWLERIFGEADYSDDGYYEKKKHKESKGKYKSWKKAKRNGPPDHAPAHGYRAKFKHYPDANIYYDTYKDVYYGMKNGKWQPYDRLPTNINLGSGVAIDLERAIPEAIRALSQ